MIFYDMDREICESLERLGRMIAEALRQCGRSTGHVIRRVIPVQ